MRTPEQIQNLRRVLLLMIGPFALLMPDTYVDLLGDRLQDKVDQNAIDSWDIRIKTNENKDLDWSMIAAEPTVPYGSLYAIKKKCYDLLEKYPKIVAIQAISVTDPMTIREFSRDSQK